MRVREWGWSFDLPKFSILRFYSIASTCLLYLKKNRCNSTLLVLCHFLTVPFAVYDWPSSRPRLTANGFLFPNRCLVFATSFISIYGLIRFPLSTRKSWQSTKHFERSLIISRENKRRERPFWPKAKRFSLFLWRLTRCETSSSINIQLTNCGMLSMCVERARDVESS